MMMSDKSELCENQNVDGQDFSISISDVEPRFRAITSKGGERRGIRLERIYWDALTRLAAREKLSMADVVDGAARDLPENINLASWLRGLTINWALKRLSEAQSASSMERLGALLQAAPVPALVLTTDKRIRLFNEPFVQMLRHRLSLPNAPQLTRSLRFSVDLHLAEAVAVLQTNGFKPVSTGFSIACGGAAMRGQLNMVLAPAHDADMVLAYVAAH